MKINGGGSIKPVSPTGIQEVAASDQPGSRGPVVSTSAQSGDKVEITSLSAQLQQLEKLLNDVGIVDSAKVDAIKQAITEGHFSVDSEVVADKLLASVREYLVTQKG